MTDSIQRLKKSMVKGGLFLVVRQVFMQGLNIAGSIFLARILSPAEFGLFAIFSFFLAFLTAFGDVGLAASLVREDGEPQNADYTAVFSVQLVLITVVSAIFFLVAPLLSYAYGLGEDAVNAFRLLTLALWITVFMTMPMVQLERQMAFKKIALIEVSQALVFNVTAVVLADSGYGIWSFAFALVGRALAGVVLANIQIGWRPRWHWEWSRISGRLVFGLHFQGVKFVSLIKDSVSPIVIGFLLGATSVGYVNWAGMVAAYPVMALFVLQRLYLPGFARMQADRSALGQLVEGVIWLTNAIAAPLAMVTLVFSEPIVTRVFGEQWLVAMPLFYWYWAANLFVATVTPVMSMLDAVGLSKVNFKFSIIWMLGNWAVGIPLLMLFGLGGYAAANLLVQLTNLLLYRVAQREAPFKILKTVLPIWVCAAFAGFLSWLTTTILPIVGFEQLVAYGVAAVATYIGLLMCVQRARIRAGLRLVRG